MVDADAVFHYTEAKKDPKQWTQTQVANIWASVCGIPFITKELGIALHTLLPSSIVNFNGAIRGKVSRKPREVGSFEI